MQSVQSKAIEILSNPIYWIVFGLVVHQIVNFVVKGELMGVQVLSKEGDAAGADGVAMVGDAVQGILTAIAAGRTPQEALGNAKAYILTAVAQQKDRALKDVEGEIGFRIEHALRLKSGHPELLATTPSGMGVDLPIPGAPPAKSAGFGMVLLMAAIALAALLGVAVAAHAETLDLATGAPESAVLQGGDPLPGQSEPAFALGGAEGGMIRLAPVQVENPVVIDHWIVGILCPGLRFDLKGAAPAAVAAGSGVSFNYIFGRYIYTSPNGVQHPWFGISLFAQGAVNLSPGSIASTTETAAVGAGIIILNYVVFGWIVDLLAGGANGPSGILAGQMSLSNTGPVVLTSIPLP